jgi:hypothetical protein
MVACDAIARVTSCRAGLLFFIDARSRRMVIAMSARRPAIAHATADRVRDVVSRCTDVSTMRLAR